MKKYLLPLILLVFFLSACGSGNETAQNSLRPSLEGSKTTESSGTEQSGSEETSSAEETKDLTYLKERAGTYYLNSLVQGNEIMKSSDIAEVEGFGMEMLIHLKDDGKGQLKVFGETRDFSWDDKTITFTGEASTEYTWSEDGGLGFRSKDATYVFSKEKAAVIAEREKKKKAEEKVKQTAEADGTNDSPKGDDPEWNADQPAEGAIAQIEVVGADWLKSEDITAVLCIWYDYTNLTGDYLSPYAFAAEVQQDGKTYEEYEVPLDEEDKVDETGSRYMQIQPGTSNRSVHFFEADPSGGKITYTVTDAATNTVLIKETFDPKALPGRPEKSYVPEEIPNVTLPDSVPAKGVYEEDYQLEIKTLETVSEENTSEEMIRVWFEFTNNSDSAISPYMVLYLRAIQDGMSLNPGWSSLNDSDLDKIYKEVKAGATAKFCYEWYLISESPVSVEAYDWFSGETVLGKVFELK